MDTAQWPQGIGVVQLPIDGTNNSDGADSDRQTLQQTRPFTTENNIQNKAVSAPRPQKPPAINCPRCHSAHTKFCYYNNYSLSQPRYFCKTCRRYWTEGGSLRNVPVGGGSRKNKRSSSSSSSLSSSLSKKLPETINSYQNPNLKIFHESQDLNLAYPPNQFVEFTNSPTSYTNFSQFFKSGNNISGGRGFSSLMSSSVIPGSDSHASGLLYSSAVPGSGLPFHEFSKTSGLNFSTNQHQLGFDNSGHQGGFGSALQAVHQENNSSSSSTNHAKLLNFPIEDLKQPDVGTNTGSTNESEHNGGTHHRENDHLQSSGLIWSNGDLGGGASW